MAPSRTPKDQYKRSEPLHNAPSPSRLQHSQSPLSARSPYPFQLSVDPPAPEEMIGVALGSPGQSPLPPLLPEERVSCSTKSPEPAHANIQLGERDAFRSKGSRWKGIGGLFGKKSGLGQSPPTSSLYRVPEPFSSAQSHKERDPIQRRQARWGEPQSQNAVAGSNENSLSRNWIGPEQLHPHQDRNDQGFHRKPSLRRNNVLRKQAKHVQKADGIGKSQRGARSEDNLVTSTDLTASKSTRRAQPQVQSLLQVDIPSIELERYSVMFSALLHPGHPSDPFPQPSLERQPSLLARRQANNLQELEATPELGFDRPWVHGENGPGIRGQSPSKSPSFSLFPPSPTVGRGKRETPARERSPLQRSATAPALSPSKARFDFPSTDEQQDQVFVIVHTPTEQPRPQRRVTSDDVCSRIPSQTPKSSEDTFTTARASPVPSAKSSQKSLDDQSPSPQRPPKAQRQADDPLQKAAEVSIARQISISQRQRQLLVPAVPKVAPQPVQPKVVEVQRPGSRSRKSHHSQHLVFEHA
ncbi:MAG: hypothetical protein L6R39_006703 [Caloplaca ligustica]|nr:MAG: hypothetical protein L6R39_006703 [Caloplaca ligustica]